MLKIRRFLEYRKCTSCGREFLAYEVEKINKIDCICAICKETHRYSTKNYNFQGKETQISFSFEFETCSRAKELYELTKYNFIGCLDGTIGGLEWKSPIFYNRRTFHNICRKINKFSKYVGDSCGTHLHVSTPYKRRMEEYKRELFTPILEEMIGDRMTTQKFWGRYFGYYCRAAIGDVRYNAFNTKSSVETLEFRLLKFINAEQYIKACDFCIDTTRFINRYIGSSDFNRDKATKIGNIIAEKYKEVIKNVQNSTNE